jgi:hypothetical protein
MQDPKFAEQEVYRVAAKGCRVGLIRPIDAMGNYPTEPKYDRVWQAMQDTASYTGCIRSRRSDRSTGANCNSE